MLGFFSSTLLGGFIHNNDYSFRLFVLIAMYYSILFMDIQMVSNFGLLGRVLL